MNLRRDWQILMLLPVKSVVSTAAATALDAAKEFVRTPFLYRPSGGSNFDWERCVFTAVATADLPETAALAVGKRMMKFAVADSTLVLIFSVLTGVVCHRLWRMQHHHGRLCSVLRMTTVATIAAVASAFATATKIPPGVVATAALVAISAAHGFLHIIYG